MIKSTLTKIPIYNYYELIILNIDSHLNYTNIINNLNKYKWQSLTTIIANDTSLNTNVVEINTLMNNRHYILCLWIYKNLYSKYTSQSNLMRCALFHHDESIFYMPFELNNESDAFNIFQYNGFSKFKYTPTSLLHYTNQKDVDTGIDELHYTNQKDVDTVIDEDNICYLFNFCFLSKKNSILSLFAKLCFLGKKNIKTTSLIINNNELTVFFEQLTNNILTIKHLTKIKLVKIKQKNFVYSIRIIHGTILNFSPKFSFDKKIFNNSLTKGILNTFYSEIDYPICPRIFSSPSKKNISIDSSFASLKWSQITHCVYDLKKILKKSIKEKFLRKTSSSSSQPGQLYLPIDHLFVFNFNIKASSLDDTETGKLLLTVIFLFILK